MRAPHLLATGTTAFRDPDLVPFAELVLGSRAGGEARMPVLNRKHPMPHDRLLPDDAETPVA